MIFDEFQRFFEVLPTGAEATTEDPEEDDDRIEEAHHVVQTMLRHDADPATRPAVLLLSATPYRMYARLREGGRHHQELFELLRFLYADAAKSELPELEDQFRSYRERLLRDPCGSTGVHAVRMSIERRLKTVMARTERRALVRTEAVRGRPVQEKTAVEARDVAVFRHFATCVREEHRHMVEPFWSTIPYPIQMMRGDYVASRRAELTRATTPPPEVRLSRARLRDYSHDGYPHPKLRALLDAMPRRVLALPWIPPSRPWWPLGGVFREASHGGESPSKALVFSRFRAVPRALATLLSYEAERVAFQPRGGRRFGYWMKSRSEGTKAKRKGARTRARVGLRRPPAQAFTFGASGGHDLRLLLMFLPLPRLADLGDPLTFDPDPDLGLAAARERVRARLEQILGVAEAGERREPTWKWALRLERTAPGWDALREGIERTALKLDHHHCGVAKACWRLLGASDEPAGAPSRAELDDLAEHALTAPGSVLWRAMRRVHGAGNDAAIEFAGVADVALVALRSYLDAAELQIILAADRGDKQGKRRATLPYTSALRRAVWEGNLEAVLDEYLVSLQGLGRTASAGTAGRRRFPSSRRCSRIRATRLEVDGLGRKQTKLPMRCHAALPFGLASIETTSDTGDRLAATPCAGRSTRPSARWRSSRHRSGRRVSISIATADTSSTGIYRATRWISSSARGGSPAAADWPCVRRSHGGSKRCPARAARGTPSRSGCARASRAAASSPGGTSRG